LREREERVSPQRDNPLEEKALTRIASSMRYDLSRKRERCSSAHG
jgi:hypothetical protein